MGFAPIAAKQQPGGGQYRQDHRRGLRALQCSGGCRAVPQPGIYPALRLLQKLHQRDAVLFRHAQHQSDGAQVGARILGIYQNGRRLRPVAGAAGGDRGGVEKLMRGVWCVLKRLGGGL